MQPLIKKDRYFIDENNNHQIALCDKQDIWVYTYSPSPSYAISVEKISGSTPLDFTPGYISYQDGRMVVAALNTPTWRLSTVGQALEYPNDSFHVGLFQTKPDTVVATQRFPGRGNLLYVFGKTVVEPWQDTGLQLFPYQKNQTVNVDYGCINPASIAFLDNIIAWVAINEKSGPMICYSNGGDIQKISTDGIDFRLSTLKQPSNVYAFFIRQDGHLLYQVTWPADNVSYVYDFNTKMFFTVTNPNMGSHIAKDVAYFNGQYYFISTVDGAVYQMGTQFTDYNGSEIPRIRTCPPIRLPDASRFSINNLTFTIEQGDQAQVIQTQLLLTEDFKPILTESGQNIVVNVFETIIEYQPIQAEDLSILLTESGEELLISTSYEIPYLIPQTVALSMSKNGGESFGSQWSKKLNELGKRKNRLNYWQLGSANDFTPQFRFWGLSRFVCTDGIASIYQ
jgi:hypothetical protein